MIHPAYAHCLKTGKADVFATVAVAKAMLTPEERNMVQEVILQDWFRKTPTERAKRKRTLMMQEEYACLLPR